MSHFFFNNFNILVISWIVVGLFTFLFLVISKTRTPYGRHSENGWGLMINNSWAWFWMEFPALIVMPIISLLGPNELNSYSMILIFIWFTHYFNRVIIFPLRIKTKNKKMPISIAISAFFFNIFNGLFNGYYVGYIMNTQSALEPNVIVGIIISFPYFVWEMWRFIKPALHKNEKIKVRGVVFFSSLLFFIFSRTSEELISTVAPSTRIMFFNFPISGFLPLPSLGYIKIL